MKKWLFVFNVYERFETLVQCMTSFLSSKLPEYSEVYFMDDHSMDTRIDNYLDLLIKNNTSNSLKLFKRKRKLKTKYTHTKNLSENFELFCEKYKEFDYVCNLDSDAEYNYDWLSPVYELEKTQPNIPLILSPYNGQISRTHGNVIKKEKYYQKDRTGCVFLIFPTSHFEKWVELKLPATSLENVGETMIFQHLKKINGKSLSCYPSRVEHIGHVSLLNHYHQDGSVDTGIGYKKDNALQLYGDEKQKKMYSETHMVKPRILSFLEGKGCDLGCGRKPLDDECFTVDYVKHRGVRIDHVCDATKLDFIQNENFDWVFSSHCLEDVPDPHVAIKGWLRILKTGGNLILYLPDKDYYFNVGHPKANPAHQRDYYWTDIWQMLKQYDVELIYANRFGPVYEKGEWSFEIVVRKTGNKPRVIQPDITTVVAPKTSTPAIVLNNQTLYKPIQKSKPYLFCGPWVGEFGWELIWSGYCRRIAKQYKNVVVSTFPDSLGLYSDFASSYIFHSFHGNSLINQMNGVTLKDLQEYISKITKDNPNIHVLNPYTDHPFFDQHQKYNLNVNAKEVGDFPKYTLPFHGKIDVLVHARNRKDSTMANWPKEKWDELCFFLQSKGLTIGAIGTQAHCPKYCQDLRFLPLLKVMSYLQNTKLLIGPSSGAMHLGSLCGAKLLTWGFSPEEEPHALPRYQTNWNFHNTFVEYISGYKFNPPVERVTEVLRGILKI